MSAVREHNEKKEEHKGILQSMSEELRSSTEITAYSLHLSLTHGIFISQRTRSEGTGRTGDVCVMQQRVKEPQSGGAEKGRLQHFA